MGLRFEIGCFCLGLAHFLLKRFDVQFFEEFEMGLKFDFGG